MKTNCLNNKNLPKGLKLTIYHQFVKKMVDSKIFDPYNAMNSGV